MLDSGGSREIRSIGEYINGIVKDVTGATSVVTFGAFFNSIWWTYHLVRLDCDDSQCYVVVLSSLGPIFWIIYRIKFGKNVLNENWSSSSSSQHLVYFHSKIMGFERES